MPNIIECAHCSTEILLITGNNHTRFACRSCIDQRYSTCTGCDEYVYDADTYASPDGGAIYCRECYRETYHECAECSETISIDDTYCSSCESAISNLRNSAFDRPYSLFKRIGAGSHYGIELEVYLRDRNDADCIVDDVLSELDPDNTLRWVAKEDGSVEGGFELESLPITKECLQYDLALIEGFKDRLKGFKGEANGLHINCDRPASRLTCYKISRFMNDINNLTLLELVGQRELNTYCRQGEPLSARSFLTLLTPCSVKYSPVRMDLNRIEFRIFKANLLRTRINKALDFSQAVIDFCAQASLQGLKEYHFLHFIRSNPSRYPDLVAYLLEIGFGMGLGMGLNRYIRAHNRKLAWLAKDQTAPSCDTMPQLVEA